MKTKSCVAITRVICDRLVLSRQLCNLTGNEASELLGISAETLKLFEFKGKESAIDFNFPLSFLVVAAITYHVSLDYLFGITEDFDSSLEDKKDRDLLTYLNLLYLKEAEETRKVLSKYDGRIKTLESVCCLLPAYLRQIINSFRRFRELNPNFDDMKASNTLLISCNNAEKAAHEATLKMIRYRCLSKDNLYQIE